MTRLDRYIVREMVVPFLIGTIVIVLMFQANGYMYIAKTFNIENIPLVARFQWIMYQTPGYMEMTLPAGMSLAASLAVTRLQRESELTAMRAAGARILRVLAPIFLFGIIVSIANFYIVDNLVPVSAKLGADLERKNAYLGLEPMFKSNSFIQLGEYAASLGTVIRDPKTESLTIAGPLLIERPGPDRTYIITAKGGHYRQGVWTFDDAMSFLFDGADITAMKAKGNLVVNQEIDLDQLFGSNQAFNMDEQSTPELRKAITSSIAAHIDPRAELVELNKRYAVPAACTVFAVTGCVFAVIFARTGGFVGVLISLVIAWLYYNAFIISTTMLGKLESIPPWLAAWLPNLLFAGLGLFALSRLE